MKVLITGSSGYLGSALRAALQQNAISYDIVERTGIPGEAPRELPLQDGGHGKRWIVDWPNGLSRLPYQDYSSVIHLALPPSHGSFSECVTSHRAPVEAILRGIQDNGNTCSLIFITSISSAEHTTSSYGRGKWEAEQLIKSSTSSWAILRPGLITGRPAGGLFGKILSLVERLPVVPVPTGSAVRVQPIPLDDVISALLKIIREPLPHNRQTYTLALPSQSLYDVVGSICSERSLLRIRIPVPWHLLDVALRLVGALPIKLPVSRDNLQGLVHGEEVDGTDSLQRLGLGCAGSKELLDESSFLFQSIFKRSAPRTLTTAYIKAQTPKLLTGTWINMHKIVALRLNADAIELATRGRKTILSQKLQILCYLAELDPQLLRQFINREQCRLRALLSLAVAGACTAWSFIYGHYLVRRHRLLDRTL